MYDKFDFTFLAKCSDLRTFSKGSWEGWVTNFGGIIVRIAKAGFKERINKEVKMISYNKGMRMILMNLLMSFSGQPERKHLTKNIYSIDCIMVINCSISNMK